MHVSLLLLLLQALTPQQQKETFVGGRPRYSYLKLILSPDSSFRYTSQYHFERKTRTYSGTWHKAGNNLVLTSRPPKRRPVEQATKTSLFQHSAFRLSGDTLHLYTAADSLDRYQFCRDYLTLTRQH
ncbi:hypothetical protein [Hymenobacter terrestris]|uniref:Uncharacterized protein n=1 Tax=Hymenobacter terrestris TaxID=2748310 RepID=A0ABX2Q767_9BACT|nr:hypothetical protein [Hymenobacter terrestris]NVO86815.1 hypothetical protein [Hymenobacter terrestris]